MSLGSRLLAALVTLAGLLLVAGGLGSGAVYLSLSLGASEAGFPLTGVTGVASLATLGLGLGVLLVWHGLRAWRGEPDALFRPPHPGGLAIVFVGAVGIGQGILSFGLAPRLLFPPFHVLAGMLPALIILAFAGRRLGGAARQREVVSQVTSGILLGGLGAIVLVGLLGLALAFLLAILVALTPEGLDTLQWLIFSLRDPVWWKDPNNLSSLIFTPAGLAGVFLLTVIISPLVEELLKPVGVLLIWRRPGRAEAFLWGLAGASGFAAAEGMFNSAVDLDAWLPVVLMRVGTSQVHCLAGGLVGLGWYFLRTDGQPWRAVGLYLVAVALHGTWNAVVLGIGGFSFASLGVGEAMASLGIVLLLGLLGLLILVCIVALALLVRWLQTDLSDEMDAGLAMEAVEIERGEKQ